jgi:hypothetical protein
MSYPVQFSSVELGIPLGAADEEKLKERIFARIQSAKPATNQFVQDREFTLNDGTSVPVKWKLTRDKAANQNYLVEVASAKILTVENLTPLDLVCLGAGGERWSLKSLGTAEVHPRPKWPLEVAHVAHRELRFPFLAFSPDATELKIQPDMLKSAFYWEQGDRPEAFCSFLNRANVDVDVFEEKDGKQIKHLTLTPDSGLRHSAWPQGYVKANLSSLLVVRGSATGDVLAMVVLDRLQQHLTITGAFQGAFRGKFSRYRWIGVEVINLTPLEIDLEDDAGHVWHLLPDEQVTVERPSAGRFAVKVRGFRVASPALTGTGTRLEIKPDMFFSAKPTPGGKHPTLSFNPVYGTYPPEEDQIYTGQQTPFILRNRANQDVDVFRLDLDAAGNPKEEKVMSQEKVMPLPGSDPNREHLFSIYPGEVFVAKSASTSEVLAMLVYKFGDPPLVIFPAQGIGASPAHLLAINMTLRGVLVAAKWRSDTELPTETQLEGMSPKARSDVLSGFTNKVIVELAGHSNKDRPYYQGKTNDEIIGQSAVVAFLMQNNGLDRARLITMSDGEQRQLMIEEDQYQTSIPKGDLELMSNQKLVRLALDVKGNLRDILLEDKWTSLDKNALEKASDDEVRYGLITALYTVSAPPWGYQGFHNDALIGKAAIAIFLSQAMGYNRARLATMSDAQQRKVIIEENHKHTGIPVCDL